MTCWLACLLLLLYISHCLAQEKSFALIGTILTDNRVIKNGTLLIVNERIAAVGIHVNIPRNTTIIHTNGVILSGLIDLHNHLTWNVFPRWKPIEEFGSRYDWQAKSVYLTSMVAPHEAMVHAGMSCLMQRYAEIKAITQGTTSVIGSLRQPCNQGLVRNLDDDPALGQNLYKVFPLQMNETELGDAKKVLFSNGTVLIHLAEGSITDATAAREFAMLKSRGLLIPGVSFIHAVALKADDFDQMAKASVGLVWSPRSNIELYGETANMRAVKEAGVVTALAPDWSPTGSDGLLSELNYAATWNAALERPLFDDLSLISMATVNSAKLVHLDQRLGRLREGYLADILVLNPKNVPLEMGAAWIATHATPEDVALVIVDGQTVYGDLALIEQMPNSDLFEPLEVCGVEKSIRLPVLKGTMSTFRSIQTILNTVLRRWGRKLAPLSECGN